MTIILEEGYGVDDRKRGKPIAEVIPYLKMDHKLSLKDTVTFMGDIVSPVAEEDWEVLK